MVYTSIEESNIDTIVSSNRYVVLIVVSEHCPACEALKACLDEISDSYESVKFITVDSDKNERVLDRFSIRGVPTTIFFRDGELYDVTVGFGEIDAYNGHIETMIAGKEDNTLIDEHIKMGRPVVIDNPNNRLLHGINSIDKVVIVFTGCYDDDYDYMMKRGKTLAEEYKKQVLFMIMEQADCVDFCTSYKIPTLQPTVLLLRNGEVIDKIVERRRIDIYRRAVDSL